ncbi:MAG: hypothetical protein AAFQ29_10895, partial [Pseudomonadota bacterium]
MNTDTDDKYSDLRDRLLAAKIPLYVVEHAISLGPAKWLYDCTTWLFVFIMSGGFIFGAFFVWRPLKNLVVKNALNLANEINGILYAQNFGIALLVALFAWIFVTGFLVTLVQNSSKRMQASIFIHTLLDPKNAPYLRIGENVERLQDESDPTEYMKRMVLGWGKLMLWPAAILTSISLIILERELNTFTIYTPTGYLAKPLFPWEDDKSDHWTNAQTVELGCNHTTGRGASDDIIYEINFASGESYRISTANPVSGNWLDQIEIIDEALKDADVIFQRWDWLNRESYHPDCLAAQERQFSPDDLRR